MLKQLQMCAWFALSYQVNWSHEIQHLSIQSKKLFWLFQIRNQKKQKQVNKASLLKTVNNWKVFIINICISPDPKDHVSYCHHLASVVVVRRKLFQKSSPLKVLDQCKPNLVWIITRGCRAPTNMAAVTKNRTYGTIAGFG